MLGPPIVAEQVKRWATR